MNNQDYEKIKFESWIEFCKEHPIENPSMSIGEAFDFAFDRAYALGKQEKDAEGEEMLTVSRKRVQGMYAHYDKICNDPNRPKDYIESVYEYADGVTMALDDLFGSKCLPDNVDNLSQNPPENCDNGNHISTEDNKPFKVGDVVRIKTNASEYHQGYQNGYCWLPERDMYVGKLTTITNIRVSGGIELKISGEGTTWEAIDLEPYTEPKEESRNLSQETANCDKQFDNILKDSFSKERRLNIATQIMSSILSNQKMLNNLGTGETTAEGVVRCVVYTTMMYTDALLAECEKGGKS